LLKPAADELGEGTVGLRDRLQLRMSQARDRLLSLQATAVDSARSASHAAGDYVHDHPWRSAVIGMGVGMLLGLLVGQRR